MRLRDRIRRWWSGEPEQPAIQLQVADWSWTGEQPLVQHTGPLDGHLYAWRYEPRPVFDHLLPIGPERPTPEQQFAADPLGAALPAVQRVNPFYRDLLQQPMSAEVLAELEGPTGYWRASNFERVSHA